MMYDIDDIDDGFTRDDELLHNDNNIDTRDEERIDDDDRNQDII